MNSSRQITIIGGGLAGMTAALHLLERGCAVTLYDMMPRLGGKAGSDNNGADYDDHGYHIFPAWYLNCWRLVHRLGIQDNFVECSDFAQLAPGDFPNFRTLHNMTSLRSLWHNLT